MKTSIVMPAYNAQAHIAESIQSVLTQTDTDWELVIADDASTDETAGIIQGFRDERIKYHHSARQLGQGGARNLALSAARGRYIAFLDSDDIWIPEKLEKQHQFMKSQACSLVCTDYIKIDSTGRICSRIIRGPGKIQYRTLLGGNCIAISTAMVDTQVHGRFRFRADVRSEDYALWLFLLRQGGMAMRMKETLMQYRVHKQSVSRDRFGSARNNWNIYRNYEKLSLFTSLVSMCRYAVSGTLKLLR